MVDIVLQGIKTGFRIGFCQPRRSLKSSKKNLQSALLHEEVIDKYLDEEISEGRVAGLFPPMITPNVQISRFGVIPKAHQPGRWRLIFDLSHPKGWSVKDPKGWSVKDGIPKYFCSMSYISVDDAVKGVMELGRGTLLAKIDPKNAFRMVPVHPADRHLLAMRWRDRVYIDTCLPIGLRSTP